MGADRVLGELKPFMEELILGFSGLVYKEEGSSVDDLAKVVVGFNDELYPIPDNMLNSVEIVLQPNTNDELCTDPRTWHVVDLIPHGPDDDVPDWFIKNEELYVEKTKNLAYVWSQRYAKNGVTIPEISSGCWLLVNCEVGTITGDAFVYLHNTKVKNFTGNADCDYMWGSSRVECVSGNARIYNLFDDACIHEVTENATAGTVGDNAVVEVEHGVQVNRRAHKVELQPSGGEGHLITAEALEKALLGYPDSSTSTKPANSF